MEPRGATGGNRWQIGRRRKPLNTRKPLPWVATRCRKDGKEGVDGSSPSEGFAISLLISSFRRFR